MVMVVLGGVVAPRRMVVSAMVFVWRPVVVVVWWSVMMRRSVVVMVVRRVVAVAMAVAVVLMAVVSPVAAFAVMMPIAIAVAGVRFRVRARIFAFLSAVASSALTLGQSRDFLVFSQQFLGLFKSLLKVINQALLLSFTGSLDQSTDLKMGRVGSFLQQFLDLGGIRLVHNQNHSQAAIEGSRHFPQVGLGLLTEPGKQGRNVPLVGVQLGGQVIRQTARDVLQQTAACYVGHGFN